MPDNIDILDLSKISIEKIVINKISASTARFYNIMPVKIERDSVIIASRDPSNMKLVDDLRFVSGLSIKMVMAKEEDIKQAIEKYYGKEEESLGEVIDVAEKTASKAIPVSKAESDAEKLKEIASSAPVVKLLNMILLRAVREKASDVHFEPFGKDYKIRYRIDGICYDAAHPPKNLSLAISSRIKVMANLDVAENRLPQDGRIMMDVEGKKVDLRVSSLPAIHGESVVMRILDKSGFLLGLEDMGLLPENRKNFEKLIGLPNGMILVTGPTGSGKTTTLYAALSHVNQKERKVITI